MVGAVIVRPRWCQPRRLAPLLRACRQTIRLIAPRSVVAARHRFFAAWQIDAADRCRRRTTDGQQTEGQREKCRFHVFLRVSWIFQAILRKSTVLGGRRGGEGSNPARISLGGESSDVSRAIRSETLSGPAGTGERAAHRQSAVRQSSQHDISDVRSAQGAAASDETANDSQRSSASATAPATWPLHNPMVLMAKANSCGRTMSLPR